MDLGKRALSETVDVTGAFAALQIEENELFVELDSLGTYPLFRAECGAVTSSFVAACEAVDERRTDPQGFFEYVLTGAVYGAGTYVRGVSRIDSQRLNVFSATGEYQSRMLHKPLGARMECSFDEGLEGSVDLVRRYLKHVVSRFGDEVASALTGGFDSRLLLAGLMAEGVHPQLWVGGGKNSPDVRIAHQIARGEGLSLLYEDSEMRPIEPGVFRAGVRKKVLHVDGMNHGGTFQVRDRAPGSSPGRRRFNEALVSLNGGGGEIFRDYWELPDAPDSVHRLVRHGILWKTWGLQRSLTPRFSEESFAAELARKMQSAIGVKSDRLSREEISYAYPSFRVRHWTAAALQASHHRRHALLPYADGAMARWASRLPARLRFNGTLEAAMIHRISPRLAQYPTCHGHHLLAAPPTWKRAEGWLRRHTTALPPGVLLYARDAVKARSFRPRPRPPEPLLSPELREAAFGNAPLEVEQYFNVFASNDHTAASRALTVETVIGGVFRE